MRVPVSWLRSYCDPPLSTAGVAEALNMSGTEVEHVDRVGVADVEHFVIGKVLEAEQHPDADRLRVCKVDDGSGAEPRTIVCGAPNVAAGQTVAVALPGAVLPNGQELGEVKLRGVTSSGMILAEDEVGVGEDHGGIMVLPDHLPAGAPLLDHLQIADEVLDIAVAPNRPDCLGVYGVAREVHAVTRARLEEDPTDRDATPASDDTVEDHASLEIADPDICLRFTARVFEDVRIGPSPLWLKARLMAAGQRPISNVVDITNYVMLATAQPLHAFDLEKVRGRKIVVRRSKPGERMTTLDGIDRELDPSIAVVCDAEGPSGIAGIMGGQISEVGDDTTRVLMEAATWVGPNILLSEGKLGLRTEASTRFEKQLHPEQAMAAQRLAARLMVELCGARMVRGTLDAYPSPLEPRIVRLRLERIARILGVSVPREEVVAILRRLGFRVTEVSGRIMVTIPYWRDADVQREADLIEEVGRIYGLEKIPRTLPARREAVGGLTREQRLRRKVEDALRDRGLDEVVAYSFTSPRKLDRLRLDDVPVLRMANPLSEEQSVMRPLLLPGLLDAARHNAAHGRPDLAVFESAHVHRPAGAIDSAPEGSPGGALPADERHHLSALFTRVRPGGWRTRARAADFYAVKGVLEGMLGALELHCATVPGERPFLHPGRAANVLAGADGRELGWIGELHPLVARAWDLEDVAAFEIDLDLAVELAPGDETYRDVTTYPAVVQDIAVVAPEDVPAAEIEAAVRAGGGDLLDTLRVFDLYRGEQVGEGNRSLALRLEFRSPERTLTDEDVAALRQSIEARLAEIGGRLRA
jgi:phenylalanyl-tRNA synthetase beta chain